jgi:hypothetical protein
MGFPPLLAITLCATGLAGSTWLLWRASRLSLAHRGEFQLLALAVGTADVFAAVTAIEMFIHAS